LCFFKRKAGKESKPPVARNQGNLVGGTGKSTIPSKMTAGKPCRVKALGHYSCI
jgi:hypothetical protein